MVPTRYAFRCNTALHIPLANDNSIKVLKLLLDTGADVKAVLTNGSTPLH